MMMNRIFYACVFLFACVYNSVAMAEGCPEIVGPNPVVITPASPQSYSGPQDSIPHGEQIGTGFSGEVTHSGYFVDCISGEHLNLSHVTPIKAPISGVTYNDGTSSYEVYDTGVPGIGYAVGVKDSNSDRFLSMNYPTTQTYPASGTDNYQSSLGFTIKIVFVATGHLASGSYAIPAQTIATLSAIQRGNGDTNQAPVNINGVTVNVTSTGCDVTSASNATINLGDILPSAFTGVGSLAGSGSTTLSLQCDTGIQLWASMADSSNPANTTQTLSLTPDSVAQGVGIQFFANGSSTPVTFGPDSSSKGLPYGFFIDNSTGDGSIIEFPIVAKYIQTGRLAPGSANGIATVTFSYQ